MCDILSFMFVQHALIDKDRLLISSCVRVSALDSGSDFHRGARRTLCSMDVIDQTIDTTISPQKQSSGKIARLI